MNRIVCRAYRRLSTHQVRASSIVDLTVAMVILTLVTASALVLYLQVTRSGHTLQQLRWDLWLEQYASQTKQTASYQSERLLLAEGIVEKKILHYQDNPKLILLEITFHPATENANGKTHTYREIIEREHQSE